MCHDEVNAWRGERCNTEETGDSERVKPSQLATKNVHHQANAFPGVIEELLRNMHGSQGLWVQECGEDFHCEERQTFKTLKFGTSGNLKCLTDHLKKDLRNISVIKENVGFIFFHVLSFRVDKDENMEKTIDLDQLFPYILCRTGQGISVCVLEEILTNLLDPT